MRRTIRCITVLLAVRGVRRWWRDAYNGAFRAPSPSPARSRFVRPPPEGFLDGGGSRAARRRAGSRLRLAADDRASGPAYGGLCPQVSHGGHFLRPVE
ncbi:hypothetical protein Acsp03_68840 [Actinomadura sp. NBRC 104412]|nr:hypothetical protein Acsp03_68840 [Actinomadura sp. NBRC 104412]